MKSYRNNNISTRINQCEIRILLISAVMAAGIILLLAALAAEQFCKSGQRQERITRQSVRSIRIPAKRGKIFTSDLKILADNRPECNLIFYPHEMLQPGGRKKTTAYILAAAEKAAQAAGRINPLTEHNIAVHLNMRPGLPITVLRDLTMRETAKVLEAMRNTAGTDLQADEIRYYPAGHTACHLLGYTRADDASLAYDRADYFYYLSDRIGVEGIEKAFDKLPGTESLNDDGSAVPLGLRGEPGYSLVQVDHMGFIRDNIIRRIEPRHGNNLIMTIDYSAQSIAESLISGKRAAIVVLDAGNGDVVAAASSPSFNLTEGFSHGISSAYFSKLLHDSDRPLYNRAFSGSYSPGSILKVLVSLALLNSGMTPDTETVCDGGSRIGDATIRCASWRNGGHGVLNLRGALEHSCNDYMIENGIKTGLAPIAAVLRSAGIGKHTGVELPDSAGIFPSEEEKQRRYHYRWNSYDTALLSIGQGIITLSPLQAALYCAAIANGGTVYRPHTVLRMVDAHGNSVYEREVEIRSRLDASKEALETVRHGMYDVVNSPAGSGRRAKTDGLDLYGKTGSAETGPRSNRRLTTWFIAFTSYKGKTYSCCVMVEEGSSGGASAAPLAADFFRSWLLHR